MKKGRGWFGKYLPQMIAAAAVTFLTEMVKLLSEYVKKKGGEDVEKKDDEAGVDE